MKEVCEKCGAINDTLEICDCQKLAEKREMKKSVLSFICIIICASFLWFVLRYKN